MTTEEKTLSFLDTQYSYDLAKRMEKEKTNPILGFRTAGSDAESATGEMLYEEMKHIGLSQVTKDVFTLDGWEFKKAVLKFEDSYHKEHICQMSCYQANFITDGFCDYELVYVGKGTAADYKGKDVNGKLVLAEINQRDEWWISFPVYQAYLKGAAAFIAVQAQGYAEVTSFALNAQDIAGPDYAPAFSMSQADAEILKNTLDAKDTDSIRVQLDAVSRVLPNVTSANIVGKIPGRETDSMILLSAHYDSYFDGFQDDNAAVALMFGIARAIIKGGYQPAHTLVFCAMAAEEWGVIDSKYDWSTGAYNQVFRIHPEWQGHVIADLNFELPAHAHSTQDAIRCTYEYADFMKKFVRTLTVPQDAYPDGMTVLCPIETWSDDFSMAIAGIPSLVNDFSAGPFMQNYYHSQYDNQDVYQEPVYRFHHECYTKLILTLDQLVLPPLNFGNTLQALTKTLKDNRSKEAQEQVDKLLSLLSDTAKCADKLYEKICAVNDTYRHLLDSDQRAAFRKEKEPLQEQLLDLFRKFQDYFVRLNWHDEVVFPQEEAHKNILELQRAISALEDGDISRALRALYRVDNNRYAFLFDEEVYYHFTEYILHQPRERLMWGAGRILHHENLYGIVHTLKKRLKECSGCPQTSSFSEEIRRLLAALRRQNAYYMDDLNYISHSVQKVAEILLEIQ